MVHLQGNFQFASGLTWNMVYRGSRDGGSSTYVGFNDPPLWERLSADSYFLIYGNSEYKSTSEYGEWPFWGRVTYCASQILDENPKCAVPEITCESARHRLRVLRN